MKWLVVPSRNWLALEYAAAICAGDREIVQAAVDQDRWALKWASEAIAKNSEIAHDNLEDRCQNQTYSPNISSYVRQFLVSELN
eukprot:5376180-Amphidinium_carterae.1